MLFAGCREVTVFDETCREGIELDHDPETGEWCLENTTPIDCGEKHMRLDLNGDGCFYQALCFSKDKREPHRICYLSGGHVGAGSCLCDDGRQILLISDDFPCDGCRS